MFPYKRLVISAWVKLNYASLSGGGYAGSEYPMAIRVKYLDFRGGEPNWAHGFYYDNPERRPTTNAERIVRGEWYFYVGDLATLDPRPSVIRSIEVLGSGHDFDAEIADIHLIAE